MRAAAIVNRVRTRPLRTAVAISALLGGVYLLWQPATTDLAAQTFRAELWEREGFVIWSSDWYGGHTIPGYSLLYPPLGAWLGPAVVGALSALAATWLFGRLAAELWRERAWLGVVWFALAPATAIFSGRITFALGLALGLGALLAVHRRRPGASAVVGLLTAAASPVAGLFLLLACAALVLEYRVPFGRDGAIPPRAAAAAVTAAVGAGLALGALALAFPTDGHHPFVLNSFAWIPLIVLAVGLLVGRREGALLWGALLYLALAIVAVAIDTPLGGNATRLGAAFAGPLLAILLLGRRPVALALIGLPLLWWQCTTAVADVAATVGDPSGEAGHYRALFDRIDELEGSEGPTIVHLPPTRSRWEAVHVAARLPLARGWLRQLESDDFAQFRDGPLGVEAYGGWLRRHGVSYVALPADVERDYLAEREAELLEAGGLPFLREVHSDPDWRVWEVRRPDGGPLPAGEPLAGGGAEVVALGADGYSVRVPGPGDYELRLRHSPYLEVAAGDGCIAADGPHATRLSVPAGTGPGVVRVEAALSLDGLLGRTRACPEAG